MPAFEELMAENGLKPMTNGAPDTSGATPPANTGDPVIPLADPSGTPPADPTNKTVAPHEIFGDEYKEKDWEAVKSDFKTRAEKLQEMEARLKEMENKTPEYADEEVAAYDAWLRNGGKKDYDAFKFFKDYNSESVDDIEKVVMKQVMENPDLRPFKDKLKNQLIEKYGLAATEDNDLTPEQVALNKALFKDVAKQADEFLKQQSEKLKVVDAPKAKLEELVKERQPKWQSVAEAALTEVSKIQIPIVEKEGERYVDKVFGEFELPSKVIEDYKKQLVPQIADMYSKASDPTPEMVNHLKGQVFTKAIVDNLPWIISQVKSKVETDVTEALDKKYNGGVIPKAPGGTPAGAGDFSARDIVNKVTGG
jgi:hypothetical protein